MFSKLIFSLLFTLVLLSTWAQPTRHQVFSHNDYSRDSAFHLGYRLGIGYLEADVILENGQLWVAHERSEIRPMRDLNTLYLKPLDSVIQLNEGYPYADKNLRLVLMIDLKTGDETLATVIKEISRYPRLVSCKACAWVISGNRPPVNTWTSYPEFVTFDGRPDEHYDQPTLKKVGFISTSFWNYSRWNGKGNPPPAEFQALTRLIENAHQQGKYFRFWASPDTVDGWANLIKLGVDVLGTDRPRELVRFLETRSLLSNRK